MKKFYDSKFLSILKNYSGLSSHYNYDYYVIDQENKLSLFPRFLRIILFREMLSSDIQSRSTLLRDNFSVILIFSNLYFYRATFDSPMRLSYINIYCKTLVYSSLSIRIYWYFIIYLIFTCVLCSNCFFFLLASLRA